MKRLDWRSLLLSRNTIGILLCVAVFLTGFTFYGDIGMYFNLAGLLIVLGGTLGATLISYSYETLAIVYKVLSMAYLTRIKKPEEIVEILVDLSVKSRFQGLLSLQEDEEETSLLFLREALGYLVDGYSSAQIRELLSSEMYFFKLRRHDCEQVLKAMADLFPAFGLAGSVVGLVGMLSGMGDTSVLLATVPVALTSTLYGVVLANFCMVPFAANIRARTEQELLLKKIIMEGVIAIASEMDPRVLEKKLKSFLTPSARRGRLVSLARIQARFKIPAERSATRQSAA